MEPPPGCCYPWEEPYNIAVLHSPRLDAASIRRRLLLYKKFSRFYLFQFQPITQREAEQHKRQLRLFRFTSSGGPLLVILSTFMARHRFDQLHTPTERRRSHLVHYMLLDLTISLGVSFLCFTLIAYKRLWEAQIETRWRLTH